MPTRHINHSSQYSSNLFVLPVYNRIAGAVCVVSTTEGEQPLDDSFDEFEEWLNEAYPGDQTNAVAPNDVDASEVAKSIDRNTTSRITDLVLPGLTKGHWCVRIGNLLFESMANEKISPKTLAERIRDLCLQRNEKSPSTTEIELVIQKQLHGIECAEAFYPDFGLVFDFVSKERDIITDVQERLELIEPNYENLIGLFASAKNVYSSDPEDDEALDSELDAVLKATEQMLESHDPANSND